VGETSPGLAGSAYGRLAGLDPEDRPPSLDLEREDALQRFVREAIARGLVTSAQDVARGGLAVALAECAAWSGRGARLRVGVPGSPAVELFGESPSRVVLGCRPRHAPALELLARHFGLPVDALGSVGGERLVVELAGQGATGAAEERGSRVADAIDVAVADLAHAWEHGLPRALAQELAELPLSIPSTPAPPASLVPGEG
jgi:phosphoribosylformylglycinamidine synthase